MELVLSTLAHTWLLDLDGTLVKHNGYKLDGADSWLPGAQEFLAQIDPGDTVVLLTSRPESLHKMTEDFLQRNGVRYDYILYGLPYGERILVNDRKPSGLCMVAAIDKPRDGQLDIAVKTEEQLGWDPAGCGARSK